MPIAVFAPSPRKLGVSIGLIRHHFEEKQQLIAETYRYVSRELQAVSEAAAAAAGEDPRERFRAYVMAGVRSRRFWTRSTSPCASCCGAWRSRSLKSAEGA